MIELLQTSVWLLRHRTEPLLLVADLSCQKFASAILKATFAAKVILS